MFFWGFAKRAMDYEEVKQVELNWHRLYDADLIGGDSGGISETGLTDAQISEEGITSFSL